MRWKCAWTYFKAHCPILNTYYKVCGVCCGGSQNLWGCPYSPSPTIIYLQFVQQWYPVLCDLLSWIFLLRSLLLPHFSFAKLFFLLPLLISKYFLFFHVWSYLQPRRTRSRSKAWEVLPSDLVGSLQSRRTSSARWDFFWNSVEPAWPRNLK